jgi:hypothetical protein
VEKVGTMFSQSIEGKSRTVKLRRLAESLTMLASQIEEHADDKSNQLPNPWRFDDWLTAYRSVFSENSDA